MTQKSLAALAAALCAFAAAPVLAQAPAPTTPAAPAPAAPTTPAAPTPAAPVTPPLVLATVAADDPAVKAALAATDKDGARKLLGKPGAFQGTLVSIYAPSDFLLLEFAANRDDALASYIAPANAPKFAGLAAAAQGKRVLVSGTFSDYQGHMEIVLTDPSQLKLVK